jgi:hypothetical protein
MGVEIRPEFHPPVKGLVYQAEGKALADCIRSIHSFSKKRRLRPITDFLDHRDMPEDQDQWDQWKSMRADWHSPEDGLRAVRALAGAIQEDPHVAQRWNREDPEGLEMLLDDIEELTRCLECAVTHGSQFRLDIV